MAKGKIKKAAVLYMTTAFVEPKITKVSVTDYGDDYVEVEGRKEYRFSPCRAYWETFANARDYLVRRMTQEYKELLERTNEAKEYVAKALAMTEDKI